MELFSFHVWLIMLSITGGLCVILGIIYAILYYSQIKPWERRMVWAHKNGQPRDNSPKPLRPSLSFSNFRQYQLAEDLEMAPVEPEEHSKTSRQGSSKDGSNPSSVTEM